jgi:branched-subunit amino acid transport protein AzlD
MMRRISWLQLIKIVLSAALLSAAISYVVARGDWSTLRVAVAQLSWASFAIPFLLIIAGALLAAWRLQLIAKDLGYSLNFRDSVAALSLGQLIGLLFFQVVGQLLARGAFLSRRNIPVSGTLIATGYERVLATAISFAMAIGGAIYLFGQVSFDEKSGGALIIKLVLGSASAVIGAALLSWGALARKHLPRISAHVVRSTARNLVLSLVIQLTTMGAYVVLAGDLAPAVPTGKLVAASTLVMLGASLPISLAGWGMREMSAILALGAIGVSTEFSLAIAVSVGLMSIAVVILMTLGTVGAHWRTAAAVDAEPVAHFDYGKILDYVLPLAAASAIFVQAFVPLQKSLINVNLADPFAIIAGVLFVLHCYFAKSRPHWRLPYLEYYVLAASLVFVAAFLHGVMRFGWTDWAFANKLLGWFILLCYGACGALIVNRAQRDGFDLLMRTYAASAVAVVIVGALLLILSRVGVDYAKPLVDLPYDGFSANKNSFGFQLLLAVCAVCAARWEKSEYWLAILLGGLFFADSRAALLALAVVVGMTFYLRIMPWRVLAVAGVLGAALFVFVNYSPDVSAYVTSVVTGRPFESAGDIVYAATASDDNTRVKSLVLGWEMFKSHPIFGAGLGAFIDQQMRAGNLLIIHSSPLWLLAETGIIGFIVVAAPLFRVFFRQITTVRKQDVAGLTLILVITAFGVEANAHEMMYQRAFWLVLGAGLACAPFVAKHWAADPH